jgi:CDP-diglyceride synthetase
MFIHDILIYLIITALCIFFSIILDIYESYKVYRNKKKDIKS